MKKILKIILILIVVFFLILGIIWMIGRNSALKDGKEPLSFRQFLGLSTKKNPTDTIPGETGSDFTGTDGIGTNDGTNGNGTDGTGINGGGGININGGGNVNVSTFTDGTTNPGTGGGTGTNPGGTDTDGDGIDDSDERPIEGGGDIGTESPGDSDTGSEPVCSEEDLNIEFTPAQLAQLNILQTRFYTIAQTLRNDADVETEVANRDAFAIKADNALSLYAYCESKLPYINAAADNRLEARVATPFWRSYETNPTIPTFVLNKTGLSIAATDPAKETWTFLNIPALDVAHLTAVHDNNQDNPEVGAQITPLGQLFGERIRGPYGLLTVTRPQAVPINESALGDTHILMPVVEKILRINLW